MSKPLYLQVAIPVPLRQIFTYLVPASISQDIKAGERVLVSFGHRQVVGIVLNVNNETDLDSEKIKPIVARLPSGTHIPQSLLSFLSQCAQYYHHPIGEVFHHALPVNLRQTEEVKQSPTLIYHAKHETVEQSLAAFANKRSPKQKQLLQLLHQHQQLTWPELKLLGYTKAQLNALLEKALVEEHQQQPQLFNWQSEMLDQGDKHHLSAEQSIVVSAINQTNDKFSCHLIDGVTGSGKTEVYLQIIEQVLSDSKQVLILVPEIGLTPQTLSRFEQRFNVPIFLHHSGLNNNERFNTWSNALSGSAAIVLGTRSAIFSPMENLGMIIVDEEHDSSFKQQDSFRYHGRDIAILRAKQLNIPIVLGSATPSLESLQNAKQGKYHYHQLTKRAGNSQKASITLIDVNTQKLESGISPSLQQQMATTLARNEQVLIFINRRGFAPAIHCNECHWVADCQRCLHPYTFHKHQQLLICHRCNSQKRIMPQCPQCGSVRLNPIGQGTEQVEQWLSENFSQYSTVRIDRDSTRRKGELAQRLEQVTNKEHQILIGTQMLAKGHHFPDVTLVAMLDIDGALFSYDFRAAEHMAQLIIQVAGRAGRASKPGKVLIQTQYPQHPLLQDLVHNGYHHFAQSAIQERKWAKLPPFGFQALVRAEATYANYPEQFLRSLAQLELPCECAGPMPAAIEKKAGKYRYHLILQGESRQQLHQAVNTLLLAAQQSTQGSKVRWSIDIDPIDLSW